MKQALIIFVRNPVLGMVKTRLAATVGKEAALSIYKKLLEHTLGITLETDADKFVFYADNIIDDDIWKRKHYFKLQQEGSNLGLRMQAAFKRVFDRGYGKVCIIGSDCFELTPGIIKSAFSLLDHSDVVIGPAKDGGYYLLGMKEVYAEVFLNKNWSTDTVLKDTIKNIEELQLRLAQLPVLADVDEAEDLPEELRF